MKLLKPIQNHWLIVVILIGAAILRFWHLEELTTFSGDQGYDFLIVKRMLVDGKFTLLGPKIGPYNEIGNLYLGPAYYYLIAPFLLIFRLDPIGPAVGTAALAVATIAIIYLICNKFISKPVALLASTLYAFNTFLINQSRASSNPHLIPLFACVLIYSTAQISVSKSKSSIWPILAGLSAGVMFQLHYLGLSLIPPFLAMMAITRNLKKLLWALAAFLTAISPQILFETRHEFFITNLFIKQLSTGQNISTLGQFRDQLLNSLQKISQIFLNSNEFLYILIPFLIILIIFYIHNNRKSALIIEFLTLTIIFGLIFASIYSRTLELHYFASIYAGFAILIATALISFFSLFKNIVPRIIIIIAIFQIFAANILSFNLDRQEGFTMPKGWNLNGIKKASKIITGDVSSGKTFNIASTLDGDTRARPYRYLVEVMGKVPLDVEHYPESDAIYLVARDDQKTIKSYTVWEVSSFAPFEIDQNWDIQNGIKMYKLTKAR